MHVNFYIKTGMFLLFLIFSGPLLSAQTSGKITGIVQDEDGKGFPDVSLRLGRESATMSNGEGGFSLRIPAGKEDTLKVAYIGYKTLLIPFFMLREGMVIPMKPSINQLEEVRISILNGEQIVRNAIQHIPDNYPLSPFEANGFYREVGKLDSSYLSFAEAGLLVFNQGYGHRKLKDQLSILKERNLKKVGVNAVKNPFGTALKGVPYVVLNNDLLKHPGAILGKDFIKKYDYTIAGSTIVEEEEAYLINFDQKKAVNEALYQGTMVIIKGSFAIASVDFRLSEKGKVYAKPDIPLLQRPILSLLGYHFEKKEEQLSLRYYKINEKWYPYYYHIATSHRVRARKQKINAELSVSAELFISKVNGANRSATNALKVMPADYSFQHLVDDYQDDYWKTFDNIKPEQSLKRLIDQQAKL
ncbi:carboxypeptidase-like regulatory domain-containing protein [Pedobacter sp. PACM 27299]|uniref:carboxypeptidase-like regulatory domain-containing protein n=1 Tax=Pedobacter sp. PACM 27299 TaxID=1727164 RepID=UPI000B24D43A|nr:carboxypeptidase-like regulatory domain-containing protein [Pedobacter sp. PACM 27299]